MPEGAPPSPIKPNLEAKAPEKPRPPKKESPPPKPKPGTETPPAQGERPQTRAQQVIARREPVGGTNARIVLEDLAAQPTPPQPAPAEPEAAKDTSLERRAEIDALLAEASQLLFELKDARVALTALARQAADTPLGREFADQVLAMVQNIDTKSLSANKRQAFDALKQKMLGVHPLPQPETQPQDTELYKFLKTQPANEQTAVLIQALEQGAAIPNVVEYVLKRPELQTIASSLRKELFGNRAIPQNAQELLEAAGIDVTKANIRTMKTILNPKDKLTIKKLGSYLFIALMIMMLSSQVLTPLMQESEGQRTH